MNRRLIIQAGAALCAQRHLRIGVGADGAGVPDQDGAHRFRIGGRQQHWTWSRGPSAPAGRIAGPGRDRRRTAPARRAISPPNTWPAPTTGTRR